MKFLITVAAVFAVAAAVPAKRGHYESPDVGPALVEAPIVPSPVHVGPLVPGQLTPLVHILININDAASATPVESVEPEQSNVEEKPAVSPVIIADPAIIVPSPVIVAEGPSVAPVIVADPAIVAPSPVLVGDVSIVSPVVVADPAVVAPKPVIISPVEPVGVEPVIVANHF